MSPSNIELLARGLAGFRGLQYVYAIPCDRPGRQAGHRQLIKTGTKQVLDAELRRIAVPTALLWGRHDRFVPLGLAGTASARLGWPLHVIDDAGHVPHIEQTDAFVHALHVALGNRAQGSDPARIAGGGR